MKEKSKSKETTLKRKHKQTICLNDKELSAVKMYCKKYKILNRSRFIRETIITTILEKFEIDYPSLFDQNQMKPEKAKYYQTTIVFP